MVHPPLITELVDFHYNQLPKNFQARIHLHHYFQLDLILSGKTYVQLGEKKGITLDAQEGLLIPPLVRHGYRSKHGYKQGMFKFHLSPYYWSFFGSQPKKFRFSPFIAKAVALAGARFNAGEPLARELAMSTISFSLIQSVNGLNDRQSVFSKPNPLHDRLYKLLEEVSEPASRKWTVVSLANQCGLSVDHFCKCFQRLVGLSPQKYLGEIRMRNAAAWLSANPPCSIKEVAERAHYADVHSFTKAFRKTFGVTPGRYRDMPH
jgi:AraC-like DNA-binding protein